MCSINTEENIVNVHLNEGRNLMQIFDIILFILARFRVSFILLKGESEGVVPPQA